MTTTWAETVPPTDDPTCPRRGRFSFAIKRAVALFDAGRVHALIEDDAQISGEQSRRDNLHIKNERPIFNVVEVEFGPLRI
jgi:hypothetical protein